MGVVSDTLIEYPTGKLHAAFKTSNFTCEETIDNQYMLSHNTTDVMPFFDLICLVVALRCSGTDRTTGELLLVRLSTNPPTISDACNTTLKQAYNHHVALRQGYEASGIERCPSLIFGTYLYGATGDCLGTTVDVCSTKENVIFNYNENCTTTEAFTINGTLDCVHAVKDLDLKTTYLTVYNQDSTVDDTQNYRYLCFALDQFESDVRATVHPLECISGQTASTVASSGKSYTWTPTADTEPVDDLTWVYILIGSLLGLILILLLILCIVCMVKRAKTKPKVDEEAPIVPKQKTPEVDDKPIDKTAPDREEPEKEPEKKPIISIVEEENEKNLKVDRKPVVTIIPEPTMTKEYDKISLKSGDSGFANDPVSVTPDKKPTDFGTRESHVVVVDENGIVDDKSRPDTRHEASRTSDLGPSTIPPVSREGTSNELEAIPSTSTAYVDPGPPSDRAEEEPADLEATIKVDEPDVELAEKPIEAVRPEVEDAPVLADQIEERANLEIVDDKPIAEPESIVDTNETEMKEVEANVEEEPQKEEETVQEKEAEPFVNMQLQERLQSKHIPVNPIEEVAPRVQTPAIPLIIAAETREDKIDQERENDEQKTGETKDEEKEEEEANEENEPVIDDPSQEQTPETKDTAERTVEPEESATPMTQDSHLEMQAAETVALRTSKTEVETKDTPTTLSEPKKKGTRKKPKSGSSLKRQSRIEEHERKPTPRIILVKEPTNDSIPTESKDDPGTRTFSEIEYESGTTDWVTESETLTGSSESEDMDDTKGHAGHMVMKKTKPKYQPQETLSNVLVTRRMSELKREKTEVHDQPKQLIRVLAKSRKKTNDAPKPTTKNVPNEKVQNSNATLLKHTASNAPYIEQYRSKKAIERSLTDTNFWNQPKPPVPTFDDDEDFEILIPEVKHAMIAGEPVEKDTMDNDKNDLPKVPGAIVDTGSTDTTDSKPTQIDIYVPKMKVEPRVLLNWESDSDSGSETDKTDSPLSRSIDGKEVPEQEDDQLKNSFQSRISNLFTRPRLKRNKRGRPTGGYVKDDYGPKNENTTEVERITPVYSDTDDEDDRKQPRFNETPLSGMKSTSQSPVSKFVGFNVRGVTERISQPQPDNEGKPKMRADASSANRRLLRNRLFKANRLEPNEDHLPIVSEETRQKLAPLVRTHPAANLHDSWSFRHASDGNHRHPARTESDRVVVDPGTIQMFREGLKKDQAVLSKLSTQTPSEYAHSSPKWVAKIDHHSNVKNKRTVRVDRKRFYNLRGRALPMPFDGMSRQMFETGSSERDQTSIDANTSFMVQSADSRRTFDDRRLHMLLEELYKDKKYFDFYLENTEPNSDAQANALGAADQGREFLLERADYWEERGPIPPRPPPTAFGQRISRMHTTMTGVVSGRSTMLSSIASTCTPTSDLARPQTVPSAREFNL
ncbi:hypothetical protein ScPMuIL_011351 [Solemya velum]